MNNAIIEAKGLTKSYGPGKGVFELDFSVEGGECFGYLGPNGAGKTTTLRLLMGFIRAKAGKAAISGRDCFTGAAELHAQIGYLPGELALMDEMTGWQYIELIAAMRGMRDLAPARRLAERFELNGKTVIRKMSKGNKQKVGLICAFMPTPKVLLLDEPTSGLDPLMQSRFIELLLEEKQRGATIFLSTHIFEEVERTCDRAAILREGRIIYRDTLSALREGRGRSLSFSMPDEKAAAKLCETFPGSAREGLRVSYTARPSELPRLLSAAGSLKATDIETHTQTLEELFLHLYGGGK